MFAAIPEVVPGKSKGKRSLGSCCLDVPLPLKVVVEGHTKMFGAVCDLKALTMMAIVGLSTVSIVCHDSQHRVLLCIEAHLSLGFPLLQSSYIFL